MKERAFVADAREAKGLHEGSVTCLVRVPKLHDSNPGDLTLPSYYNRVKVAYHYYDNEKPSAFGAMFYADKGGEVFVESPFGPAGDRLWIKEDHDYGPHYECLYRADRPFNEHDARWQDAVHMPRWSSRTILDVTDVRVVRAQEIDTLDILAMGILGDHVSRGPLNGVLGAYVIGTPLEGFRKLIGEDVFDANSWLWLATVAKVEA